jgi:inner membrane protein
MDPLSHALIGGLTAKTAGTSKKRFWIMALLGMAPDIDVLFNGFGSWASMLQHRGLTHSFVGVAFLSFVLSWVMASWDKGPFGERAGHYSLGLLSHLAGDLLTNFGVPLLAPFTFKGYCFDLLGSVSPLPIIVVAAGLSWLHYREQNGWRSTALLWTFLVFYISASLTGRTYAGSLFPQGLTPIPSTVNPFSWRAVEINQSDRSYHTFRANILTGKKWQESVVPMPTEEFPVWASSRSLRVKNFLKENRWPVVRVLPQEKGGWRVEWGTLLFSTRGQVRGKVAVSVSSSGSILSEENIFSFWNPV